MNAKIKSLILAAMLALSLAACSYSTPHSPVQNFYSFTDHTGSQVVLAQQPQRVAVLFSSFADIWQTAGGTVDITVGETVERGFAAETAILVDGGAGKTIDNEALVASAPDFVICSADIAAQTETADLLKKAGIPCAVFRVETFEDYLSVLKICTDITGRQDLYKKHGTDIQQNIEKMLSQTQDTGKKILFIRAGSGASATKAKTAQHHFAAAMLQQLGTYNIAENAPVLLDGLSIEEIITQNPEYIFISTMGDETAAMQYIHSVFAQPQWQVLAAVKEENYIFLPKELFQYKPNARWDTAYEYLAEILYE